MTPSNNADRPTGPHSPNGAPQEAANSQLPPDVKQLTDECNRLRAELARVQKERDDYLEGLKYLTRKEIEFDEEEALALARTQEPFQEFIAKLAQSSRS